MTEICVGQLWVMKNVTPRTVLLITQVRPEDELIVILVFGNRSSWSSHLTGFLRLREYYRRIA